MAKLLSFEEIIEKAYDGCVKDKSDRSLLREIGINEEVLDDKCLSFVIAMMGLDPQEEPPSKETAVAARILAKSASMGFEWGWRSRKLYDKGK